MQFQNTRLANGLEIIAETSPRAYSAAVGFFVRTGSRDEGPHEAGVAHFLEHMMFKGTPRRSADDVNREFDEIGAYYNAATSEEFTFYYASVLPEYLPRTMELWTDCLRPALRDEDFQTEKQVILEEIQMYEDQPPYGADDKIKPLFFGRHPLAGAILGTPQSITDLPVDVMRSYFAKQYSPSNIVLAASGRVDFDELVKHAEQMCGSWTGEPMPRVSVPLEDQKPEVHVIHQPAAVQSYLLQLMPGPSGQGEERYAAALLSMIVGDDTGSRFYWDLVDGGLVESASLGYQDYADCGTFQSYIACQPEDCEETLDRLDEIYTKLIHGVTEQELRQAKNKAIAGLVMSGERPRSRLFGIGGHWLKRREYRSVREEMDSIENVTPAQIQSLIEHYPLNRAVTLVVGPRESLG